MTTYRMIWEDADRAREIVLVAEYRRSETTITVDSIYPTQITFYDPESRQPGRTIGVHTISGKELIVRQFLASRAEQISLEDEIQAQLDLLDEGLSTAASRS